VNVPALCLEDHTSQLVTILIVKVENMENSVISIVQKDSHHIPQPGFVKKVTGQWHFVNLCHVAFLWSMIVVIYPFAKVIPVIPCAN